MDWDKFASFMLLNFYEQDDRTNSTQVPQWQELKYVKRSVDAYTMEQKNSHCVTIFHMTLLILWLHWRSIFQESLVFWYDYIYFFAICYILLETMHTANHQL